MVSDAINAQGVLAGSIDNNTLKEEEKNTGYSLNQTDIFSSMMTMTGMEGMGSSNPHDPSSPKYTEHEALLNLVKHSDATHFAVNDGSWFDANTWANGEIPGDNARVVISEGVSVTYDSVSDARLFTVRVDGELNFATDTDSKMVVDTCVVDPHGVLIIGTQENPVEVGMNVDIVIANNGAIDVSWDPTLVSRGLIAHGHVEMHGEEKTTHLKVSEDPMTGDTSITLSENPEGWHVGDTIILAGTRNDGYKWNNSVRAVTYNEPQDEVLTITSINGNTVSFDTPLAYDHDTPRADLKTSVANYTRNVSIETENADTAEVHERGHVMFMHNDNVDVRYVELHELGRTDKSQTALNASEFETIAFDSNVKGRYSLHIHKAGTDDAENPVVFEGNAVYGSPGWGYVHHDSNAIFHDNASFDTFGAGFVAETGNETGVWSNNIAINAQGVSWATPKNGNDVANFDMGKTGSGFYFQGRMVEAIDNIAVSTNSGFAYFHRGRYEGDIEGLDGNIKFDASSFDLPEALGMSPGVGIDDAPIMTFVGNETFASNRGFFVEKANPNQQHDVRTVLEDFTGWSVINGAHIAYTSHYLLKDFDLIGRDSAPFVRPADGIEIGTNASDITIINAKIDGFTVGMDVADGFNNGTPSVQRQIVIVDADIQNVSEEYVYSDLDAFTIMSGEDMVSGRFELDLVRGSDGYLTYKEGYPDPTARHVEISGTKTDSVGEISLPAGTDNYDAGRAEVIRILEQNGYYSAGDRNFFVLEDYYSDRMTGEIHKFGELVEIDSSVRLGSIHFSYTNAKYLGEIDLNSVAPIAVNDVATTTMETDVIIDLLANDSDADGDSLRVDGIVQPIYGKVFDNGDGTITYRPNLEYTGTETFKYWTTDDFGNYTPGYVTVEVTSAASTNPVVDDMFIGTSAAEIFDGDLGNDTVDYNASLTGVDIDLQNNITSGGDAQGDILISIENIIGSDNVNERDWIWGDANDNVIEGLAGADILEGGAGADIINGGDGWDYSRYMRSDAAVNINLETGINTGGHAQGDVLIGIEAIVGSAYGDNIIGSNNNDYIKGENGDDTLSGGIGWDLLFGGEGNDTFIYTSGKDSFTEQGTGIDRVEFDSFWSPDNIISISENVLVFAEGVNQITFNDIALFEAFSFNGLADMTLAQLQDYILADSEVEDKVFVATSVNEVFDGGDGNDTVDYSNSIAAVKIDLQNGTASGGYADNDIFDSIENIIGSDQSSQRDWIWGDANDNVIEGLAGADILEGGAGADIINGGDGWDYSRYLRSDAAVNINLETGVHTGGHAQGDTLINIEAIVGSNYNDVIIGGTSNDYLSGSAGNDMLYGGAGIDMLIGGSGADQFIFEALTAMSNIDRINDFKISEGDVIDISDILSQAYNDPLTQVLSDFVQITDNGINSTLSVDIDGGGDSFVAIATLYGITGITDENALMVSGNLVVL